MKFIAIVALLLREAAHGWVKHRAQRLGAALAFYTTLSLAPLAMIAIAVAGSFYNEDAARGAIVDQIEHFVGRAGATTIESLLENAGEPGKSRLATVISLVLLAFGATSVFAELKDSLDTIWEVQRKPGLGLWTIAKTRLLAFTIVVGVGFLLLVSLALTTSLTAFTHWLSLWLPVPVWTAYLVDVLVSFLVITFLFALIFRLLPDVKLRWRDVWLGSVITALLFMIGKSLISLYIGRASVGSIYGAAGSLVVVLIWTYYSSQILFFGAELIRAHVKYFKPSSVVPMPQSERVPKTESTS